MKKLILPLLLLVAFGMLAAVESDPSEVVGYVKYNTSTGINYLALPMSFSWSNTTQFAQSFPTGTVTSVAAFDNATHLWKVINRLPTGVWTGTAWPLTNGNLVRINGAATVAAAFYSIGDLPATMPSWTLYTGINYLSIPLNKSSLTTASLLGNNINTGGVKVNSIGRYNNTTKVWQIANRLPTGVWTGTLTTVAIGDPIRVNAVVQTDWPVRGTIEAPLSTSK
ncbi:MAG: hypothetical protein K0B87_08075 [Candidatus Syntrophosphaera sp.]|nr:hypothetical protein [Candidatus Syntrophosphaera sp.]